MPAQAVERLAHRLAHEDLCEILVEVPGHGVIQQSLGGLLVVHQPNLRPDRHEDQVVDRLAGCHGFRVRNPWHPVDHHRHPPGHVATVSLFLRSYPNFVRNDRQPDAA